MPVHLTGPFYFLSGMEKGLMTRDGKGEKIHMHGDFMCQVILTKSFLIILKILGEKYL